MRNWCRYLVGKLQWKRSFGRHRRRYKDNIKTDFGEM
jgi:hypothetical protein